MLKVFGMYHQYERTFDRLVSDGDVAYTYDAAGNRLTRTEDGDTITYTLGLGDRLASWTGGVYTHDTAGNVLSEVIVPSAATLSHLRYRFQGREWSAATGLINFRMRWYDAETGRWLSKDPIGLSGGLNLYAFCDGDPLLFLDANGTAKVGSRRLKGAGALLTPLVLVPGLVIPMRLKNTFPEHRHIFFDDGTNIGWGPDGFFCDEDPSKDYTMKGSNYNDDLMRKAVNNVRADWSKRDYNGLSHNCQDFVDAVLDEYDKLLQ